mmetsp:Transcript_82551/g.146236  ORF Transcript_82551/g.146236 Transcript_82551/m.146236 type:complete len:83 (-) Transcript_82551:97-345(-)
MVNSIAKASQLFSFRHSNRFHASKELKNFICDLGLACAAHLLFQMLLEVPGSLRDTLQNLGPQGVLGRHRLLQRKQQMTVEM